MRKLSHLIIWLALCLPAAAGQAPAAHPLAATASQLMEQGRQFYATRQADKALECFEGAARQAADSTQLRIRALNNAACVYKYFYQDHLKAYDYLTRAYQLCDSTHYDEFMPVIMVNMGDLINDQSATANSQALSRQAHDIFEKCISRAYETHNYELMTTAFFNLSNQNYTLPLKAYGILFDRQIPDSTRDLQYVRLQYQGISHIQQGRYAEALHCFQQQLAAVSARWEPVRDSIATNLSLAHTYHLMGDHQHQMEHLVEALRLATDSQSSDQAAIVSHLMVEARAQQLDQRQRMQQMVILAIGTALLAVLLSALLLWRKNRQLSSRNRSLYEKNLQLLQADSENQQLRRLSEEKYSHSNLSDDQKDRLLYRIDEVMHTPDTICQQDFTLARLAKLVESNTTYVSQAVNERYATSFSNVLAGFRIREACRRMSDDSGPYRHVTIEAIAASVGFKSRTAFINAFKREVGLTPSEYLRQATANKA